MFCNVVEHPTWTPKSQLDRVAVRSQLERVLKSAAFKSSKRCLTLLRHVVESVLEGNVDCLKERMLGVSVFGRKPTYDTSQDPIVRMTAVEIRRRLALYYQQSDDVEIFIALPSGSYVPEFSLAKPRGNHFEQRPPLGNLNEGSPVFIVVVLSAEEARNVDIGQIGEACRSWLFEDKNRREHNFGLQRNLLVAQMSGAEGSLKLQRS